MRLRSRNGGAAALIEGPPGERRALGAGPVAAAGTPRAARHHPLPEPTPAGRGDPGVGETTVTPTRPPGAALSMSEVVSPTDVGSCVRVQRLPASRGVANSPALRSL